MLVQQDEVRCDSSRFGKLGIIVMQGCEEIGHQIDDILKEWRLDNDGFIISSSCPRFTNGEGKAVINQSVRGCDIFIICDCYNYSVKFKMYDMDVPMSPDTHYRDLLRIISALSGKPKRINVIMPRLYGGRQDKRISRESLDCAMSLQELAGMGVSNILTFDAHDPMVQNAIPLTGFDTIMPSYQMIKALYDNVDDIELTSDKALIISPDEGAMRRSMHYSSMLGDLALSTFYKRRDYSRVVEGRNSILSHIFLGSEQEVKGKDVILVDDIMATGESIIGVAELLKEMGAKRIFIFVTFGEFSHGTDLFDKAYQNGIVDRIFVAATTYKPDKIKQKKWFCDVDMSKYLARLIDTLNCDVSISRLLTPKQRINELVNSHKKN